MLYTVAMKRVGSRSTGYTLVETMIFLGVSGVLFSSAMILISGQQNKTEFNTVVREFDAKLQSVVNNVASGYYHNSGQTQCTLNGSGEVSSVTSTGGTSGSNQGCIFVGQFIEMPNISPSESFDVTSYAGQRRTSGREVLNYDEAKPKPISDAIETYNLNSGVTMTIKSGPTWYKGLAIISTFGANKTGTSLGSGSLKYDVYLIPDPTPSTISGFTKLTGNVSALICLTNNSQYAAITLNSGNTETIIGEGTSCP